MPQQRFVRRGKSKTFFLPAVAAILNRNERQSVATGPATAGSFTLTFNPTGAAGAGTTTAAIAFNATAAVVQTALEALTTIDPGDVIVTGGPLPGAPVVVEFTGRYAFRDLPQMVGTPTGLTGGVLAVTTTQEGATAGVPTRAEINAGTDLSSFIADINGWALQNQAVKTPDMGSDFDSSIPGIDEADDSSLSFYEDELNETIETLLRKGTSGFITNMRKGDRAGSRSMDTFPIRAAGFAPDFSVGNEAARTMCRFTITDKPALDAPIPAPI